MSFRDFLGGREKMKILKFLFLLALFLGRSSFAMEEGILKINQPIVHPIILDQSPGAVTLSYVLEGLKAYEKNLPEVWAIDLTGTYMSAEDVEEFLTEMAPKLPELKVLALRAVHLREETWAQLFEILPQENIKFIDACSTRYSNRNIRSVLQKGQEIFKEKWTNFSRKIIFASKDYYPRLHSNIQWPKEYIEENLLPPDWVGCHQKYYKKYFKHIERGAPLHFLTGDSDADKESLLASTPSSEEDFLGDAFEQLDLDH